LDQVLDIGERLDAVITSLALAEVVQVGPVNDQYFQILFLYSGGIERGAN
jgi:hypothetical protein